MKTSNDCKRRIHRRDLHRGAVAASLAHTAGALGIPKSFGQTSDEGIWSREYYCIVRYAGEFVSDANM